jgi:hypothetical protein
MKRFAGSCFGVILYLISTLTPLSLWAVPIRSTISVRVAKGGWLGLVRYAFSHFSNGPLSLDLNVVAPEFVYGITNRVALISLFPIVINDFDAPPGGGPPSSSQFGLADIPLLVKVDIFNKFWVGQNLGLSLVSGLEIPSGNNPFSSNSIDFPFGVVFTPIQSLGNEVTMDFIYQINTEGGGIQHGDTMTYDISYTRRLLPWKLPETGEPSTWSIILEMNGTLVRQSSLSGGGGSLPDTGGHTLFFLPGLQWAYNNWGVQAGVQIPVFQDLNGTQLKDKFNVLINFGHGGAFF